MKEILCCRVGGTYNVRVVRAHPRSELFALPFSSLELAHVHVHVHVGVRSLNDYVSVPLHFRFVPYYRTISRIAIVS